MEIKFKDYFISKPMYLDGHEPDPWHFDVCKYHKDLRTHFVIASFYWNDNEPGWEFNSCGTRYLQYYTEGLNEWLLDVMKLLEHGIEES